MTSLHQLLALLTLFRLLPFTTASYAFYVGWNLTTTGYPLVGGTGEEVSSHWLQIFPAANHTANSTISVGVTEDAIIPGELISIPQAQHTYRYLSMEYSDYEGFPAPLTNGGLSERGIAVRDVWSDSRPELVEMTPTPQRGLQYSDLARVVLERASSAKEGVDLIGQMIAEYGYADYGGNSHLIVDENEGWVVLEMSGGVGLWAAERLGPNDVRVLYPGYIEDFPTDFESSDDYKGSPNIVTFAIEQGWWDPDSGTPFNIFNVYGYNLEGYYARDGGFKYMSQASLENETRAMVPVSEEALMQRVRDPRIADDEAGYGQVVSVRSPNTVDPDLMRIWVAPTGSLAAPFLPWWMGVQSVPPELGEHRYLTHGASGSFLNPDFQLQEASSFAGRRFKRALYYMCAAPDALLPVVTNMLQGFESECRADLDWVERSAQMLIDAGQRELARELLTFYAHTRADKAMQAGQTLVGALETYVRLSGLGRDPVGTEINDAGEGAETVNCLVGFDPDQPLGRQPQIPLKRRRKGRRI